MGRVVGRKEARKIREEASGQNRTVVFTNGCFDLLHRGHVDLLRAAKELGDLLVVGLNSDASVLELKGRGRPLVSEDDRAAILSALESVDLVVVFGEETPLELIRELKPDVLVKGADYRPDEIVGGEWVKKNGGRIQLIPLTPGKSSTLLNKLIQGAEGGPLSQKPRP